MEKIKKLLLKVSKSDRKVLLGIISSIIKEEESLKIIKIKNTDFFRVRFRQFRIIFHKEGGKNIIDSIKLRNEKTFFV